MKRSVLSANPGAREAGLRACSPLMAALRNAETKRQAGTPTDAALTAREWVVASILTPSVDGYLNFPECCLLVGLDVYEERARLVGWFQDHNDLLSKSSLIRSHILQWKRPDKGVRAAMPELDEVTNLLEASLYGLDVAA